MTTNAKPAFAGTSEASCSELLITPIKIAVHSKKDNPIFGENVIHVSVDDEGTGPFIVLVSDAGHADGLRIDPDELEASVVAARQLIAGLPNVAPQGRAKASTVEASCSATTTARADEDDSGKWRRCELVAGHDGDHETTYCGRPFRWPNAELHSSECSEAERR